MSFLFYIFCSFFLHLHSQNTFFPFCSGPPSFSSAGISVKAEIFFLSVLLF